VGPREQSLRACGHVAKGLSSVACGDLLFTGKSKEEE
jgi:hypothetical protein